uniref:Uncharacterized protein n=1 Tax=Catharus ustulatus TaxID=91951 RepID=A0A8C3TV97_CATUS
MKLLWLGVDVSRVLHLAAVFCLTCVLLKAIQLFHRRRELIRALADFPGFPTHWLFGHVHEVGESRIWMQKYPHAHPMWFGSFSAFLVVTDPDYAKVLLGRGGERLCKTCLACVSPGNGLLILHGPKWHQHRKLLTPGFHYDVLKPYVDLMAESTNVMLDKWEKLTADGKSVELFEHVSLMTLDSIMKCAFSCHSDCQTNRSVLAPPNHGRKFAAQKGNGQIACHCAPKFTSFLFPSLQEKHLHPGCLRPLPHGAACPNREDLAKMTYSTMCIKESLRLYPPVPGVSRQLSKAVTFPDGRTLPEGLVAAISIYLIHRNPEVWKDPLVFDPLRFSPENVSGRHSHLLCLCRNCIGQQFAMNEMKVALALTLLRFELLPDPAMPPLKITRIILRSKNGIHLWRGSP